MAKMTSASFLEVMKAIKETFDSLNSDETLLFDGDEVSHATQEKFFLRNAYEEDCDPSFGFKDFTATNKGSVALEDFINRFVVAKTTCRPALTARQMDTIFPFTKEAFDLLVNRMSAAMSAGKIVMFQGKTVIGISVSNETTETETQFSVVDPFGAGVVRYTHHEAMAMCQSYMKFASYITVAEPIPLLLMKDMT